MIDALLPLMVALVLGLTAAGLAIPLAAGVLHLHRLLGMLAQKLKSLATGRPRDGT